MTNDNEIVFDFGSIIFSTCVLRVLALWITFGYTGGMWYNHNKTFKTKQGKGVSEKRCAFFV
jgi:hypothetical protein